MRIHPRTRFIRSSNAARAIGAVLSLLCLGVAGNATAAPTQTETPSLVVTIAADTVDNTDNQTSLREALAYAQTLGGATVTFNAALAGQTITLTTVGDPTFGPSALKVSNGKTVTIDGGTSGITITQIKNDPTQTANAVAGMRLFYVESGATLTLKNLTLSGGRANGGNGNAFRGGGGAAGLGGAIVNAGTLNLTQTTLTNNQAQGGSNSNGGGGSIGGGGLGENAPGSGSNGGGPSGGVGGGSVGNGGFGGGGGSAGSGGFGGGGGAVGGNGGFGGGGAGNGTSGNGGFGGGNANANADGGGGGAGMGGAVFNYGGTVNVTNSTLTGNSAKGGTGGNNGQGLGGAIFNLNGTVTTTFATIANNIAPNGGGIYSLGDNGIATQSGPSLSPSTGASPETITTVKLNSTIISGTNDGANTPALVNDYVQNTNNSGNSSVAASVTSRGTNNLLQTRQGGVTDFVGATFTGDPKLNSLGNNGGATQTMALQTGSPILDKAGTTCPDTATDQRGVSRPQGTGCDIGAFELGQPVTFNDAKGKPVTLSSDKGGIANAVLLGATPAGASSAYSYPNGFFSFDINGLTPGDTATVTMTLPAGSNPNVYIKCNALGTTCSTFPGAVINGNVVTLTLTDGGAGDSDNTKDGIIKDPGAAGVGGGAGGSLFSGSGAFAPVTLLMLLLPGLWRLRRRK